VRTAYIQGFRTHAVKVKGIFRKGETALVLQ